MRDRYKYQNDLDGALMYKAPEMMDTDQSDDKVEVMH